MCFIFSQNYGNSKVFGFLLLPNLLHVLFFAANDLLITLQTQFEEIYPKAIPGIVGFTA